MCYYLEKARGEYEETLEDLFKRTYEGLEMKVEGKVFENQWKG